MGPLRIAFPHVIRFPRQHSRRSARRAPAGLQRSSGHGAAPVAAVNNVPADFDTSADAPALQVAVAAVKAYQRRGGQSKGAPAKARGGQADRGDPHPDGPPPDACMQHYVYGKGAWICRKKSTCPWAKLCLNAAPSDE